VDTRFGIVTHMDKSVNARFVNILKIPLQKLERPNGHRDEKLMEKAILCLLQNPPSHQNTLPIPGLR
ncbi:MAG: hypothetical protein JWQ57_849, partial [Mucilaginibacter sp.]|nr:hypothetical protein [Mucilaginibacter sp.]